MGPARPRRITRELARLAALAEDGRVPLGFYDQARADVLEGMLAERAADRARRKSTWAAWRAERDRG